MKKLLAFGVVAALAAIALAPEKAEARYYRHHNGGGYAAAATVGLLSGALIGSQYGNGYGYRGYGYPAYGYGYGAPAYGYGYGYAPRYYTGSYGGYGYRRYAPRCEVVSQRRFHRHGRVVVQNICVR